MTLIKGDAGVRGTFGSDISVGMVVRDGCAQHRLEGRLLILAKKHSRRPVWLVVTLFVFAEDDHANPVPCKHIHEAFLAL